MPDPSSDPLRRSGPLSGPQIRESISALREMASMAQSARRHVTGSDNYYTTPGGMVLTQSPQVSNSGVPPILQGLVPALVEVVRTVPGPLDPNNPNSPPVYNAYYYGFDAEKGLFVANDCLYFAANGEQVTPGVLFVAWYTGVVAPGSAALVFAAGLWTAIIQVTSLSTQPVSGDSRFQGIPAGNAYPAIIYQPGYNNPSPVSCLLLPLMGAPIVGGLYFARQIIPGVWAADCSTSTLTVENADFTQRTSPVTTIRCDNFSAIHGWDDVHRFGRIMTVTDADVPNSAVIDWQGLWALHAGVWTGPEPDLEFIDSATILWTIVDDPANQAIAISANVVLLLPWGPPPVWYPPYPYPPGVPFPTPDEIVEIAAYNLNPPFNITYPLTTLIANNSLSNANKDPDFGRIHFTAPLPGVTVVGWQGFFVYHNTQGYIGPEPDWEIVDLYGITATVKDDTVDKRVQVSLQVGLQWTELGIDNDVALKPFDWVDVLTLPIPSPSLSIGQAAWDIKAQCAGLLYANNAGDYIVFRLVDDQDNPLGCPLACCFAFCPVQGIPGSVTLVFIQAANNVTSAVKVQGQLVLGGPNNSQAWAQSCQGGSGSMAKPGCFITAVRID